MFKDKFVHLLPTQESPVFYRLLASVRDSQVMVAASTQINKLFLFKQFKEQVDYEATEEYPAISFELGDKIFPSFLLAFQGNKLLILFQSEPRRMVVRPRWDLSVTDEPDLPKSAESDLDIAADYLEKSLTQNRRGLLAFLSASDHLEVLDYAFGILNRVKVSGLGSKDTLPSFVRLVPFSSYAVVAKNGLSDIVL